jgi:hypothetical protein
VVRATYAASLLEVDGSGLAIPNFKGEVQARVQGDVLRLAGRFRKGLGWKEDRVKIPLKDVIHALVSGSRVDLWLRGAQEFPLQRVALELFSHETAGELVDWLPAATAFTDPAVVAPEPTMPDDVLELPAASTSSVLWVAVAGVALVVALMLMVLLRRVY